MRIGATCHTLWTGCPSNDPTTNIVLQPRGSYIIRSSLTTNRIAGLLRATSKGHFAFIIDAQAGEYQRRGILKLRTSLEQ
jgi:hypothetical protein